MQRKHNTKLVGIIRKTLLFMIGIVLLIASDLWAQNVGIKILAIHNSLADRLQSIVKNDIKLSPRSKPIIVDIEWKFSTSKQTTRKQGRIKVNYWGSVLSTEMNISLDEYIRYAINNPEILIFRKGHEKPWFSVPKENYAIQLPASNLKYLTPDECAKSLLKKAELTYENSRLRTLNAGLKADLSSIEKKLELVQSRCSDNTDNKRMHDLEKLLKECTDKVRQLHRDLKTCRYYRE